MITDQEMNDIAARYRLASWAGQDADYNGWDVSKINTMVRSWQDGYKLFNEVRRLQEELYGSVPRRAME
jgi:hypothetical protein